MLQVGDTESARRAEDTVRSSVLDVVRGSAWPAEYPGRSLPHPLLSLWRDREEALRADPTSVVTAYRAAVKDGTMAPPVWAGEELDLITGLVPAGSWCGRSARRRRWRWRGCAERLVHLAAGNVTVYGY